MMKPLIESQRQLGLLLVCPSPKIDPAIKKMDGVNVPLIDLLIFGETDCSPNPSQNTILSNAVNACARPIQLSQKASDAQQTARGEETEDDDFIDPATYDSNGPFIGRKSLLFLNQELLDSGVFVDTRALRYRCWEDVTFTRWRLYFAKVSNRSQ